jgi:hypothetical protein
MSPSSPDRVAGRPEPVIDPDAATAEWLTSVLHHGGAAVGQQVVSFDARRVGTGQVGDSVRFTLTYDRPGDGPASVVGKFPARDEVSRTTGVATRSYEREVWFYDRIRPTVEVRTPRPYFGSVVAGTAEMVLVLEDLAPAAQGDQLAGCDLDQAALVLGQAAALHAPRWDDPALAGEDWLARTDPQGVAERVQLFGFVLPGFLQRYRHRLDADVVDLARFVVDRLEVYLRGAGGPRTVTHGDFRLDNMLFGSASGGYPVATVDWGGVGHGEPLADVAYFLGAGLLPPVRAAHEADLVAAYHRLLEAGGVTGYPLERCWEAYRWHTFSGLLMAIVASQIVRQEERGDEMFCVMAERHAQQALHLGSPALLE